MKRILAAIAEPFDGGALPNAGSGAYGGAVPTTTVFSLISDLVTAVFSILGIIFLFLTLYAGYLWMTAMGDSKKVTRAKDMLSQAVIGLVIIATSYGISTFVLKLVGRAGGQITF